jgi:hypothetical protein
MSPQIWSQLVERLSLRDLGVLDDLEGFRLLTSRQIQRLHFAVGAEHATVSAATRATQRALTKLESFGLLDRLQYRVGGVRHGSQGIVWQLTSSGSRLQQERSGNHNRHRYAEPTTLFVDHTLAVAEIGVQVRELERAGRIEVLELATEPANWRSFLGSNAQAVTLKPDLALVTASGDYEDHWFIEVDRATEHLPKVLAKCVAYARYAASGLEQQSRGVFPRVLWLTPTQDRATAIGNAITDTATLPADLFLTRTSADFAAVVAADRRLYQGGP